MIDVDNKREIAIGEITFRFFILFDFFFRTKVWKGHIESVARSAARKLSSLYYVGQFFYPESVLHICKSTIRLDF